MVYTVTFNPAIDYIMKLNEFKSDDINRSYDEEFHYGGKGINVSAILTRLGIENCALGYKAGFTGEKLEELLAADGINTDFIRLESGATRINVKIKAQTDLDFNACGPEINEKELEQLIKKTESLKKDDILVLAGSVPNGISDDVYERILKRVCNLEIHAVVDAAGDLLRKVLKYKPFLVKPNNSELGGLFSVKIESENQAIEYAERLRKMGALNVLVSRGKEGAVLVDETGSIHSIGNISKKHVNSVGCGDSMVAGFIAGYLQKRDYSYALKLGAACGNATAFCYGLAQKEDIDRALGLF